jgi:hypothetical protein
MSITNDIDNLPFIGAVHLHPLILERNLQDLTYMLGKTLPQQLLAFSGSECHPPYGQM